MTNSAGYGLKFKVISSFCSSFFFSRFFFTNNVQITFTAVQDADLSPEIGFRIIQISDTTLTGKYSHCIFSPSKNAKDYIS